MDDQHYLRVSHLLTLIVGILQILVALLFMNQERSALDSALSVASLINGPILGVFLIGSFIKKAGQSEALIGMTTSILVMSVIIYFELVKRFGFYPDTTPIAWTWYVLIGSSITFLVALVVTFLKSIIGKQKNV